MSEHDEVLERLARLEGMFKEFEKRFEQHANSEKRFNWAIVTLLSAILVSLITGLFYLISVL